MDALNNYSIQRLGKNMSKMAFFRNFMVDQIEEFTH